MPNHLWKIPNVERKIFLTFDDGPTPEVTDSILETLAQYKAVATFFCLGENLNSHKCLGEKIENKGHLLANHGFKHLDGWKVSRSKYTDNVKRGEEELSKFERGQEFLLRPPYGHFRGMKKVVLWTLMSGDFDDSLSKERCLSRLTAKVRSGDIIVFHDNKKAFEKLKWVLPKFLDFCSKNGFQFALIPNSE